MENITPMANSLIVLREEFDDWAVLFDPDTAEGYAINPVGVFIWKRLDGQHSIEDIVSELKLNCEDIPQEALEHCKEFIDELVKQGLAGHEIHPQ